MKRAFARTMLALGLAVGASSAAEVELEEIFLPDDVAEIQPVAYVAPSWLPDAFQARIRVESIGETIDAGEEVDSKGRSLPKISGADASDKSSDEKSSSGSTDVSFISAEDGNADAAPAQLAEPGADVANWTEITRPRGLVSAGVDFVFVEPFWRRNPAIVNGGVSPPQTLNFQYDLTLNVRPWFHFEGANGVGGRVRYWNFDQKANQRTVAPIIGAVASGAPVILGNTTYNVFTQGIGDTLTANSNLRFHVLDVEATKRFLHHAWSLQAFGGLRSAWTQQTYYVYRTPRVGTGYQLSYRQENTAIGPTIGGEARRPLFGGVSWIGVARGSILFDSGENRVQMDGSLGTFTSRRSDVLPNADLQTGLEWTGDGFARTRVLLRAALEYQAWTNAGNATLEQADLNFFGFMLTAGFVR